jgi:hypothetical protein
MTMMCTLHDRMQNHHDLNLMNNDQILFIITDENMVQVRPLYKMNTKRIEDLNDNN